MQRLASLLAVVAFAAAASAQSTLVTPNGYASTAGNSENVLPWGCGTGSVRVQFLIDSTHFTNQGVAGPIIISGLKYRPRPGPLGVSWAGGFWPNVRIDMATSPLDWGAASAMFANNLGPDRTTVWNGLVAVQPGSTAGAGVVLPWYIDIPLTSNFLYDPTLGNDLTVDVYLDGTGWTGASRAAEFVGYATTLSPARGSIVFNQLAAPTGAMFIGGPVTGFTYAPLPGLHPNFTATPRSGPVGQLVNFTDHTDTSDPGGVTSWAWDVDGDLIPDYTTQNCSHTYTTEGTKNVTLTVTSAMFGTQSSTRNAYIVIDAIDANFTATVAVGTIVVFTDTSTGNPTSWQWDFENDGIVDATSRNTAFVYPAPGQYTCRLTVADAFSNDTTTQTLDVAIIPVPVFGSTSGITASTRGFWFQSPTRFSIISARVPDEGANGIQNVALFRLAAAPPVLIATTASGGLEFASLGQPSASNIPCAVSYDAGEYVGVLGACGTWVMFNSFGTVGPCASSVLGQPTTLTRFGMHYNINSSGADHDYWQEPGGTIPRVILGVTACAAIPYGSGSPSGLGPAAPRMRASALPFVGQIATHEVTQNDDLVVQMMIGGFGRAALPLPPFGTILIGSLDFLEVMNGGAVVGPGTYPWSFAIPLNPALVGASINWQNAHIVINTGAWAMSNALEWWIDNP